MVHDLPLENIRHQVVGYGVVADQTPVFSVQGVDPRFGEKYKVIRGGVVTGQKGFNYAKNTDRDILEPKARKDFVGARCVMDIESVQ